MKKLIYLGLKNSKNHGIIRLRFPIRFFINSENLWTKITDVFKNTIGIQQQSEFRKSELKENKWK